jgi:hypothetical protein
MRAKFILGILVLVAALNIVAWAFSAPRAKTFPTALDFGGGIITIGESVAPALPASAGSATP